MEYQLTAIVTPIDESDVYRANVNISASSHGEIVGTECVFSAQMMLMRPPDESDAQKWALHVLRSLTVRLSDHVIANAAIGEGFPMLGLFKD
jgi:hypothetical protein